MTGFDRSPLGMVPATSPQLTTALILGKFPYTAPNSQKKARTVAKRARAYEAKTMFPTSLTAASFRWQLLLGIFDLTALDPSTCPSTGHCLEVAL